MKLILLIILSVFLAINLFAKITKIEFSASRCMGSCPNFELEINDNRTAKFNAILYNDIKGQFQTILDTSTYKDIVNLLNEKDIRKLKDSYSAKYLDLPTYILTITFDNGFKKKIIDYGGRGTDKLITIYLKLFELRKSQLWK